MADSSVRAANMARLLRPRSIAFVGGAQAAGSIEACRAAGYTGEMWCVNPKRTHIAGLECVSSISKLPGVPDAVLLALSPRRAIEALEQLSALGAGGAVCMSGGFAEEGVSGRALQSELIDAAGEMAVVGPNCMGVMNLFEGAIVWGSNNHCEKPGQKGAAIISQSGAFLVGITGVEQCFPLGYAISTGNQAVVDIAQCIEAVLDDDRVTAIGLYIEGLTDGNALGMACARAQRQNVPIIAIKGANTKESEAIAIGHTDAMVIEADIWNAFARRYAIVDVSTPKAMVETLKLLTIGGVPRGNRLVAITFSGGLNGLIVSMTPKLGIELPQPTSETVSRIRAALPPSVPVLNPLDLNLPFSSSTTLSLADGGSVTEHLVDFCRDVADMVVFFVDIPRTDAQCEDQGWIEEWMTAPRCMAKVSERLNIPCAVAGVLPEGLGLNFRRELMTSGVAPLLGFSDTLEAVSVAAKIGSAQTKAKSDDLLHVNHKPLYVTAGNAALPSQGSPDSPRMLNEARSKQILMRAGVTAPKHGVANSPQEVADIADNIGYPVAIKILSQSIAHKAKAGGVKLNIESAAEAVAATCEISRSVQQVVEANAGNVAEKTSDTSPSPALQFLVEKMVAGPVGEFIIGIKRHQAVGLVMMIGSGGVAVEELDYTAKFLLPCGEQEIIDSINTLKSGCTRESKISLAKCALRIAELAGNMGDNLMSLEVNPVIVTAQDEAIAADALIVVSGADALSASELN